MNLAEIDRRIKAVAPIDGVNSDGVIWFKPEATEAQRQAALAIISSCDLSPNALNSDAAPLDQSSFDGLPPALKASILSAALLSGQSLAEAKVAFKTAMDSLA